MMDVTRQILLAAERLRRTLLSVTGAIAELKGAGHPKYRQFWPKNDAFEQALTARLG
jgi:hypothetical protein